MDYIRIKGYKSIENLDFKLCPINILIGANGAGKSNFVSFFKFLNEMYNTNLASYVALNGGVNKFLYKGRKVTQGIEAELSFNNNDNAYLVRLMAGENDFVVMSENLYYKNNIWGISTGSARETGLRMSDIFRARYIRKYMDNLKLYHFHDTGKNSPFNTDSLIDDHYVLSSNGSNLGSVLYHLKRENKIVYGRIVKVIQSIAPYFLDFDFKPNSETTDFVRLLWREKSSEMLYNVSNFSDGTIRFIALVTLFLQPNLPNVIVIDEPELGLHPLAINKLSGLIKIASQKECQVIIATQSVELVSYFEPKYVVAVDRKDGASTFERLDNESLKSWLEDYTIGDLWKQNIINKGQPSK